MFTIVTSSSSSSLQHKHPFGSNVSSHTFTQREPEPNSTVCTPVRPMGAISPLFQPSIGVRPMPAERTQHRAMMPFALGPVTRLLYLKVHQKHFLYDITVVASVSGEISVWKCKKKWFSRNCFMRRERFLSHLMLILCFILEMLCHSTSFTSFCHFLASRLLNKYR